MDGTARTSNSSTRLYRRNVAREMVEAVAGLERDRDMLVLTMKAVLRGDDGARLAAVELLEELMGGDNECSRHG